MSYAKYLWSKRKLFESQLKTEILLKLLSKSAQFLPTAAYANKVNIVCMHIKKKIPDYFFSLGFFLEKQQFATYHLCFLHTIREHTRAYANTLYAIIKSL